MGFENDGMFAHGAYGIITSYLIGITGDHIVHDYPATSYSHIGINFGEGPETKPASLSFLPTISY